MREDVSMLVNRYSIADVYCDWRLQTKVSDARRDVIDRTSKVRLRNADRIDDLMSVMRKIR